MELRCTARVLSCERLFRSDGRDPVRDFEGRFIAVTRLELSQVIPSHLQKSVLVNQEDGVGDNEVESFDMTAASSPVVEVVRRRMVR
ncbi:hypothetical protein Hdeb2414_s0003g00109231 [Helianthus debilis subsp. tardiflorus]